MGKGNAAVKQWMSNRARFADLFNGVIFCGKQVIHPEELELAETEADVLLKDKKSKIREVQRHRDVVMKWRQGIELVMLACENQEKIHYAMPVRNMLYDSLTYTTQIQRLHEANNNEENVKVTRDEFLSRFRKSDKIFPVITVVMYYGEKSWDASTDLYGLFHEETLFRENKILQQYIPNYKINLIEPGNMNNTEVFRTDLQEVFGMLKYRSNKTKLLKYVKDKEEYFQNVDAETYYVIREFLHSEKMLKAIDENKREEQVDMCKALQDLYDEGIETGMEAGKEAERLTIAKKLLDILDVETIAEKVGLSVEEVLKLQREN